MKLHIVAPDIRAGDAVGNHCLHVADTLSGQGFEVALYAQRHNIGDGGRILDVNGLLSNRHPSPQDLILLSFSTFQPRLASLLELPCRKVAYFHGVTPVELLLDHDPAAAYWSSRALLQLPLLARCEHLIANSSWNLADLVSHFLPETSLPPTSVIPPITPDMPLLARSPREISSRNSPARLLMVGRMAPHKRVEDGVKIAARLRDLGIPATLDIVGSATSPDYVRHLQSVVTSSGMDGSVRFLGHVTEEVLSQCYREADVLLTCSLHEGFCIPVLEAMHQGMPTVVRRGTAATEIAGGTCLEFTSVDEGCEAVSRLLRDPNLYQQVVSTGRSRSAELIRWADVGNLLPILVGG